MHKDTLGEEQHNIKGNTVCANVTNLFYYNISHKASETE